MLDDFGLFLDADSWRGWMTGVLPRCVVLYSLVAEGWAPLNK